MAASHQAVAERLIHCRFCPVTFSTRAAEMLHIQQYHAQEQQLECPACGEGPFKRLGGLMGHIEGQCPRLDAETLGKLREKKLEFPRMLEALTLEPVKGNYAAYMPSARAGVVKDAWVTQKEPESFALKQIEFPGLDSNTTATNEKQPPIDFNSKWATGKNLFENAPPRRRPTEEQLLVTTVPNAEDTYLAAAKDDWSHPSFSPAKHYNPYTEKFDCPKVGCQKSFKTSHGLMGHLKSPAHGTTTYRCPYCQHTFKSLTAMTQHAESTSTRCKIRETDNFGTYLDQLTAGIVDVCKERNEDGTVRYETTQQSKETLGVKRVVGGLEAKAPRKEDHQWWDRDSIKW